MFHVDDEFDPDSVTVKTETVGVFETSERNFAERCKGPRNNHYSDNSCQRQRTFTLNSRFHVSEEANLDLNYMSSSGYV